MHRRIQECNGIILQRKTTRVFCHSAALELPLPLRRKRQAAEESCHSHPPSQPRSSSGLVVQQIHITQASQTESRSQSINIQDPSQTGTLPRGTSDAPLEDSGWMRCVACTCILSGRTAIARLQSETGCVAAFQRHFSFLLWMLWQSSTPVKKTTVRCNHKQPASV